MEQVCSQADSPHHDENDRWMEVLPLTCPQGQLHLAAASGPGLIPLQQTIYISPLKNSHAERF